MRTVRPDSWDGLIDSKALMQPVMAFILSVDSAGSICMG